MRCRVIKDMLIILYILIVPIWIIELLEIDMYFIDTILKEEVEKNED